jgi:hypothetical protein
MPWIITSLASHIAIDVSANGHLEARSFGGHKPPRQGSWMNLAGESLAPVLEAEARWSVHSTDAPEADINQAAWRGLYQRFPASKESAYASITYTVDLVFTIRLPPAHFDRVLRLLELAVALKDRLIIVAVAFSGFRLPDEQTETPSAKEFLSGQPFFAKEVHFAMPQHADLRQV